jgi:hypothetical protein
MRAHDTMGKPDVNITYEVVKRAADANGMTVPATLAVIATTAARDRRNHPAEYLAKPSVELSRLEDDGGPIAAPAGVPA